ACAGQPEGRILGERERGDGHGHRKTLADTLCFDRGTGQKLFRRSLEHCADGCSGSRQTSGTRAPEVWRLLAHQAVNENLYETFKDVLPNVAAWFWGHEHRLDIYGEYLGLKRGRCVGCSAVPVFEEDKFFDPKFPDVPLLQDPPGSGQTVRLGARDGAY